MRWTQAHSSTSSFDLAARAEGVLGSRLDTLRFCPFWREVVAPRYHLHAEGKPDSRHPRPDVAEAEDTQNLAPEIVADRALPTARTQEAFSVASFR
jgi:hypothetical protein